ncbi:MAG: divergent polysaccharide deacetylase family protein [Candidatus Aureabacteria bacterium]|nr:divergent polysaccharide deacetylase family protein [Candidatus Auribacterota bacterium]
MNEGRIRKSIKACFFFGLLCLVLILSGCAKTKFALRSRPKTPEEIPPRIAIVLDDAGNTSTCLLDVENISFPVTIAVLPSVAYSQKFCYVNNPFVKKIVHVPMEAEKLYPGPETIYASMSEKEIMEALEVIFGQFPDLKGFNNHMGSVFMKDERALRTVFLFAKKRKLFFLNSLTVSDDTARRLAESLGVPYLERDIFLDNKADRSYIQEKFIEGLAGARDNTFCIIQGHVRPDTVRALRDLVPKAQKEGFRFVFLEDLYQ